MTRLLSSSLAVLSQNRILIALMVAGIGEQAAITAARVATSYRTVEFHLDAVLIGLITGAFALLPIFIAVKIGRVVDRGYDAQASWWGTVGVIGSCIGLALSTTWHGLLFFSLMLGIGHTILYVGLQTLCGRDERPGGLQRNIGNLSVGNAIGQGLGSLLIAWLGGDAELPPSQLIFVCAAALTCVCLAATLQFRPHSATIKVALAGTPAMPMKAILRVPGFAALVLVNAIVLLGNDMIVVYLPLLGVERSISAGDVGAMVGLRAAASVVARFAYTRIHMIFGGHMLLMSSTLAGAIGLIVMMLPLPLWGLYAAVTFSGFALGLAGTVAISASMTVVSPATRGTAISLRLLGNRIAQFTMPFGLSLIAAVTGFAAIFGVIGFGLILSVAAVRLSGPSAHKG